MLPAPFACEWAAPVAELGVVRPTIKFFAMPYSKETAQKTCPDCGVLLDILTEWSGDYRANEDESAECPKCGTVAASDKCLSITATLVEATDT